jgi:hypothetical protein
MQKFYASISNNNKESLTIQVHSNLQFTGLFQKQIIPLTYVDNQYDPKTIMRLDVVLQVQSEGGTYLRTFAKYHLALENYNGLEVYTVGSPKDGGYDWESSYASFKNDQLAIKHLVNVMMERVRKEAEDQKDVAETV